MIWKGFSLFGLFGIVSKGMVPAPLCISGRILLWTHLDLDFLVGRLLIAASISALVIDIFRISTSLVLVEYKCPGIYSFLPGLLVYVHRAVCSNL